jgi:hypothetical protein
VVTIPPSDQIVNVGSSVSFTAAASGSPMPTVQWQVSTDSGATFNNVAGATSTTLTFATTAGQNGYRYRAVFTNVAGMATTTAATLTFTGAPAITTQPVSQSVTAGNSVSFTAAASGNPAPTVQWQVRTNGGTTFTSVAGAASPTLTFTTSATQNGNKFRAVFTNIAGTATTTAATLTANPSSVVDVTTYHNDIARTGQNTNEVVLTHANVKSATFGKLGFFATDGLVDAQPLYLSNVLIPNKGTHDVLYVVTEMDTVYAFDATTGDVLWQTSALLAGETFSDDRGCSQVTPNIGITSTPVIDRTRGPNGAIYLVAMSKKGSTYFQRLHALDITTGAELFGGPKTIQATYPGTGDNSSGGVVLFDPGQYKERTGLLLLPNGPNGTIYTAWASHCDFRPYTGWLMAYDATSLTQTSVLNVTPNGNEGAIWQSGGGLAADSSGNIYVLDGNGTFDSTLDPVTQFPSKGDFGNAFLKLSTSGGLAVADYFEMWNQSDENSTDQDLGSGGGLVLLDLPTSGGTVHLAVGAGKDGHIYVVDRTNMGKFNALSMSNNIYQDIPGAVPNGVWGVPAYFNNTVYYGDAYGGTLKSFNISNGKLSTTPVQTGTTFTYPGALPSVSAKGISDGIVWAVENTSPTAVLHAYDAANLAATELYNSNQAGTRDHFLNNKFITPTIANGKVYVGTPTGVIVFGLLYRSSFPCSLETAAGTITTFVSQFCGAGVSPALLSCAICLGSRRRDADATKSLSSVTEFVVSAPPTRIVVRNAGQLLARDRLELLVRQWANLRIAHDDPRTRIPPKKCIVIAGRTESLGSLKLFHCLPQQVISGRGAAESALAKMGVPNPFQDDASIVGALVVTLNPG